MPMYRQFGAPGASRGSDSDTADASKKLFEHTAGALGVPLHDGKAGVVAAKAFDAAYTGVNPAKPVTPLDAAAVSKIAARFDVPAGKVLPGADLARGFTGPVHGILDTAGQMGHPGFGIFKAVIEILSQLFSPEVA